MDEEEQKSDSKISVSSFFERVDSIDKVANSALSQTKSNFSIIDKQRTLINSINVSIEALETKVRDIASYILAEKKIEKDAEEDRLFEQQDEAQKGSMLERLAGLKSNNESEQTQAAGEEPKKGGGGILGTLLSLGIGAFAIKFLWPAILPLAGGLIKGALAKFASITIGGLGGVLKGLIISTLGGIGIFNIGKNFTKLANFIGDGFNKVKDQVSNFIKNISFGKDGKVDGPDSLNVEGGTEGSEEKEMSNLGPDYKKEEEDAFKEAEEYKAEKSNLNIEKNSAVNDMNETLVKKDLVEDGKKDPRIDQVFEDLGFVTVHPTNEFGGDKADKDVQPGDYMGIANGYTYNYLEHARNLVHSRERQFRMAEKYPQDKERHLRRAEKLRLKIIDFDKRFPQVTELLIGEDKQYYEDMKNYSAEGDVQNKGMGENINVEVANKNLDQNLSDSFSDKLQPLNEQIDTLSEDLTGSINTESGQMFSRPANSPNTTVTVFKNTSSESPFTSLMSNKYLSLNSVLPPEVYRAYK